MSSKTPEKLIPTNLPLYVDSMRERERPPRLSSRGKVALGLFFGLLVVSQLPISDTSLYRSAENHSSVAALAPPLGFPEKIQRLWGQYSPYLPAGGYVQPPRGCSINQVNIVRPSPSFFLILCHARR